jgi:pyridoxal biosynthesis lyase PdxS
VRYAKFAVATGKAGSEYVMQGATFFGPERPFEQPWTIVAAKAGDWRRSPDAMMAKAKELGISTRGLDSRQLEQEITTRLAA